ncbi:carbamate kinase [Thaumasiovibrio sp. DFM-14]|uniref:carbamate kinase n=1 Tax=Thaumasiovibrio sp. DFM-14 TaxID=3384792 RepID=UPI0039A27594
MKKRIVIALGGNAMLKRGEVLSAENQQKNIDHAAALIQKLEAEYSVTVVHGNGPQVGLLALQNQAYTDVPAYPLDILVAETQGMIGYMLTQALQQQGSTNTTCLLTRVEVNPSDVAFSNPSKFVGPVYAPEEQANLEERYGWMFKEDGGYIRRVVPSPSPVNVLEVPTICDLLDRGQTVICCGGGGMPVVSSVNGYRGIEAVIDKDLVSAMLAQQLNADYLLILTDADAVYQDWGTPQQKALRDVTVAQLRPFAVPDGAIGPKAEAVIQFVEQTGKTAFIGALQDADAILAGEKGTKVSPVSEAVCEEALPA